jgi:tRNA pseudouridine55 synthase
MIGILNLNKPRGITSRGALDLVKRLVRPAKCGHAGTLDPLASGVLVVCVGKATRLIDFVQQMPKQYRATFLLGRTSPTEDLEGEVTEIEDAPVPTRSAIDEACARFVGTIDQRPPVFSALKIKGRPAYALARKGRTVELAARPVTVHRLAVVTYEYPELILDIECSAGTYIRSLGRDIAESLGTGAVMSALVRTAVGPFGIGAGVSPRELTRDNLSGHILPATAAVESLARMTPTVEQVTELEYGRSIAAMPDNTGSLIVALDPVGEMIALLEVDADGRWWPKVNFVGRG